MKKKPYGLLITWSYTRDGEIRKYEMAQTVRTLQQFWVTLKNKFGDTVILVNVHKISTLEEYNAWFPLRKNP